MTLHLRQALWVDPQTCALTHGDFAVEPAGPRQVDTLPPGASTLDCRGLLVTRAFAVAHHHLYSALARGMPPPLPPPQTFRQILERVWWRIDRALDPEMVRACALSTAVDLLQSGATFVVDHHSSPAAVPGILGQIAQVLDEAGVGHLLCLELSDRDGPGPREAGLRETDAYLGSGKPDQMVKGLVGLHASFTVSDGLLQDAVALATRHGTGVHVHVAEALTDQAETATNHRCSVVERLHRAGALDLPATLLAHALHLDDGERELVAQGRAWVVQNPESNRHNAVGLFDPRGLGDRILLGTDGMHSDPLASLQAAYLDGQSLGALTPRQAWQRLHKIDAYLADLGIQRGDHLVALAYDPPTPVTPENLAAHAVYGMRAGQVVHVVAGGRVLVRDRQVQTLDVPAVRAQARHQAQRLWAKLAN